MIHYITVADDAYVLRALTLFLSMDSRERSDFTLYYTGTSRYLDSLPPQFAGLSVKYLRELITDKELERITNRSNSEFHWALKPIIVASLMGQVSTNDWIIYLDSDMFSFAALGPLLLSLDSAAHVFLCPHFPKDSYFSSFILRVGFYNAGVVGFRKSDLGKEAVQWWRDRCVESTSANPLGNIYADQKYLEELGARFSGVFENTCLGINAAPWNIDANSVEVIDGELVCHGKRLYLYHMQGFKIYSRRTFWAYSGPLKYEEPMKSLVYKSYAESLSRTYSLMLQHGVRLRFDRLSKNDFLRYFFRWLSGKSNLLRL